MSIILAQNTGVEEKRLNQLVESYQEDTTDIAISALEYYERYNNEENLLLKEILSHFGYVINTDTSEWLVDDIKVVKQFQQKNFIRIDGKIGPETLSTMSFILHELYKHNGEESVLGSTQSTYGKILFNHYDHVQVGDIVKYWHYDFDKWLYARVIKIVGTTVTLNDWRRSEYFIMDMDHIEGY